VAARTASSSRQMISVCSRRPLSCDWTASSRAATSSVGGAERSAIEISRPATDRITAGSSRHGQKRSSVHWVIHPPRAEGSSDVGPSKP
jgi:hypothetical protein